MRSAAILFLFFFGLLAVHSNPINTTKRRREYKWEQFFTKENELMIPENEKMCSDDFNNRIVYCEGRLVEAVNYHRLYEDSKEFVDKPLRFSPEKTMEEFDRRFTDLGMKDIDVEKLKKFVEEYFEPVTSELIECIPDDWTAQPPKIMQIKDKVLREWALQLNGIWKTLCRQIDPKIKNEEDKHSIIWVEGKFIVPGGRFREFYYWDSYWIIRGLLISGMTDTAKSMTRNFGSMIERFGFVPNGGRVYFTKRSQPPLLAAMVYAIFEETGDLEYLKEMLPILEREFKFFDESRKFSINGPKGPQDVYMYKTGTFAPRPESMAADLSTSSGLSPEKRRHFFHSAASAAESGWDFSSRWFADRRSLRTMETVEIAPVDLNSFMCYNMKLLSYFNGKLETKESRDKAEKYEEKWVKFQRIHDEVFYNKAAGGWYDFNNRTHEHIVHNYPSVASPLFTGCYDPLDEEKPRRLFDQLEKTGFFGFSGGIPASMVESTDQQWDFPNGWSHLNHMIVEGFRMAEEPKMQQKAFDVAAKWIRGNFRVYRKTQHMYEKYDVVGETEPGTGGEYDVQTGFGWSNGVILDLLYTYADTIEHNSVQKIFSFWMFGFLIIFQFLNRL